MYIRLYDRVFLIIQCQGLLPEFEKAKEETGSKEQDPPIEQEIDLKVCKQNISVIHPCGNAN
jgi:hypothetical protein